MADKDCPTWKRERARLRAGNRASNTQPTATNRRLPPRPEDFPTLVSPKRTRSSATANPPPKRPTTVQSAWASTANLAPSTAPSPSSNEILLLLQNQARMLEEITRTNSAILQILLRLAPAEARSVSDPKGAFTFISHNGKSVIDLGFCSFPLLNSISDFAVLDIPSASDHLQISVRFNRAHPQTLAATRAFVKWNPALGPD